MCRFLTVEKSVSTLQLHGFCPGFYMLHDLHIDNMYHIHHIHWYLRHQHLISFCVGLRLISTILQTFICPESVEKKVGMIGHVRKEMENLEGMIWVCILSTYVRLLYLYIYIHRWIHRTPWEKPWWLVSENISDVNDFEIGCCWLGKLLDEGSHAWLNATFR